MNDAEIDFWEEQKNEHKRWLDDNYSWLSCRRLKAIFGLLKKEVRTSYISTEDVLERTDLHDVISQYAVVLFKKDNECMAKCPFHKDDNASLGYNRKKGLWHCHAGCGGGTAIDFVMKAECVDFSRAKKLLLSV